MIRPLRQRHHRIFAGLGVFLPVTLLIGIAARQSVTKVDSLPPGLVAAQSDYAATVWERSDLFADLAVRVRLLRETRESGDYAMAVEAIKDFAKPDLIVYWAAGTAPVTDTLPNTAQLLGSFGAGLLRLPSVTNHEGVVVLYGLADQQIVGISRTVQLPVPTL